MFIFFKGGKSNQLKNLVNSLGKPKSVKPFVSVSRVRGKIGIVQHHGWISIVFISARVLLCKCIFLPAISVDKGHTYTVTLQLKTGESVLTSPEKRSGTFVSQVSLSSGTFSGGSFGC